MSKQNLRVMRTQFEVLIVLKDNVFTAKGQMRRSKKLRKLIADTQRFEAHRFIDAATPEEIFDNSTIEIEEVEVEEDEN